MKSDNVCTSDIVVEGVSSSPQQEYSRLVDGLASAAGGVLSTADREVLANPTLPADLVAEAVRAHTHTHTHTLSL